MEALLIADKTTEEVRPQWKEKVSPSADANQDQPIFPDEKLAALVGGTPQTLSDIVSKLLGYIEKRGLQGGQLHGQILTDDKLREIFNGEKRIPASELTRYVAQHIADFAIPLRKQKALRETVFLGKWMVGKKQEISTGYTAERTIDRLTSKDLAGRMDSVVIYLPNTLNEKHRAQLLDLGVCLVAAPNLETARALSATYRQAGEKLAKAPWPKPIEPIRTYVDEQGYYIDVPLTRENKPDLIVKEGRAEAADYKNFFGSVTAA